MGIPRFHTPRATPGTNARARFLSTGHVPESTLPSEPCSSILPARLQYLTSRRRLTKRLRGSITTVSSGALWVPVRFGYSRVIFSDGLALTYA